MFTRDVHKLSKLYCEDVSSSNSTVVPELRPGMRWVTLVTADGKKQRVGFEDKYYKGFETMPGYEAYKDKGVPVIAFPANGGWSHGAPPMKSKIIEDLDDPIAQNTEQPVS